MKNPFFSICIPNYNYAHYLGETIESVLNQNFEDFEICIADNASNDNSWEVINSYIEKNPHKIIATRNTTNLGFASNLDIVSNIGTGKYMIMLSSDDIMEPGALETYYNCIKIKDNQHNIYYTGVIQFNDNNHNETMNLGYRKPIWDETMKSLDLSSKLNTKCYELGCDKLLRKGLLEAKSPYHFVSLCYSRKLYKLSGGYGGSRIMNPDKWFHFRISAIAEKAIYIDRVCFKYRWHNNNQTAKQTSSKALKFWIDEYRTSFEIDKEILDRLKISQEDIQFAFLKKSIYPFVLKNLKESNRVMAWRILLFGISCYPSLFMKRIETYILILFLLLGPFGTILSILRN